MRLKACLALLPLAALVACGRSGKDGNEGAAPNGAVIAPGAESNVAAAPNGGEAVPSAPAAGRLDALAGVRVGTSIADLRASGLAVEKDDGPDPDNRCGYARIAAHKDMFFMLDGDTVVRIDVDTPGHPVLGGVEVSMSETEALRRIGARAHVLRNVERGAAAHDFLVHEDGAPFGLIVETDGAKVVSYRLGQWAAVNSTASCL